MKKWIKKLREFFFPKSRIGTVSIYTIKYANTLNPDQMRVVVNRMINQFYTDCKPNQITVSVSLVAVEFSQPCMSGEAMKNVAERTLENNKPNEVLWVKLDGNQIWPKTN